MAAPKHDTTSKFGQEAQGIRPLVLPAAKGSPIEIPVMSLHGCGSGSEVRGEQSIR